MRICIKNYNRSTSGEALIGVFTPYSAAFVEKAKKLGGEWDPANKCWLFSPSNRKYVERLLDKVYGEHGEDNSSVEYVRVQISLPEGGSAYQSGFEVGDVAICYATGRDSGAKVSDGVICLEGGYSSGGSIKNWRTLVEPGSIFEVTVPRVKAKALVKIETAGEDNRPVKCEIVRKTAKERASEKLGTEAALLLEGQQLAARLAKIESLLGQKIYRTENQD